MSKRERAFIRSARVARLATADGAGRPHVVPICFVLHGTELYSPIDEKPKQSAPFRLKRVVNIRTNAHVSVLVDRYDDDWGGLAYVLITGKARVLTRGRKHKKAVALLRKKYPQYRTMAIHERPIIQIATTRSRGWGAL